MTEEINRLKLLGKNIEDLKIISAYCQDSIVKIKDTMEYLKRLDFHKNAKNYEDYFF